jgi:hypothetical protein
MGRLESLLPAFGRGDKVASGSLRVAIGERKKNLKNKNKKQRLFFLSYLKKY